MLKCKKGYTVEPQRSAAGYYMGTKDEEGFPNCRISNGYAKTAEDATKLLLDRQDSMENQFCHGGCGCCVEEVK